MTRALGIVAGAMLILLYATLLLVVMPSVQLRTGQNPPEALQPYSQMAARGREHYISLGCVYCHTQQPRDPSHAPDMSRGWGRPSVPSDYSYDAPHLLGTMRTGPDLLNIAVRQPSRDWQLAHLYQPRAFMADSIMPAYPFLFTVTDFVADENRALKLPPEYLPDRGYVVPTQTAEELVAYLLELDRTHEARELPVAEPPAEQEVEPTAQAVDEPATASGAGSDEAAAAAASGQVGS